MSTFHTGLTGDLSSSRLGKPGGFAPLGLDNKVPSINLPTGLAGGLALQGGYDASTNTPDLTAGAQQNDGALYIVTVEGTQDIGNGSELFTVGDAVFYSSGDARWYKLEGSTLSIEVAYDNGTSGLVAVNVQDAIDELAATSGAGTPLALQTERTTLTANRTLTNTDKGILNVEVDNVSFNTLTLPASPTTDKRFLIRNQPSSVTALVITGQDTLPPGAIWEGVYDGVEWITI